MGCILKYIDIATMGNWFLLASPRLCFCFAVQVSGFLVWSTVLCDCACCVSVQGLVFSQGLVVRTGLVVLCVCERQRACIAKRIAFLTKPTRHCFDNIYVTKRVIHIITFKQFFNENANHHSFIKYKTNFANLTDEQMEQIEYEMGIDWVDYRMERV